MNELIFAELDYVILADPLCYDHSIVERKNGTVQIERVNVQHVSLRE